MKKFIRIIKSTYSAIVDYEVGSRSMIDRVAVPSIIIRSNKLPHIYLLAYRAARRQLRLLKAMFEAVVQDGLLDSSLLKYACLNLLVQMFLVVEKLELKFLNDWTSP